VNRYRSPAHRVTVQTPVALQLPLNWLCLKYGVTKQFLVTQFLVAGMLQLFDEDDDGGQLVEQYRATLRSMVRDGGPRPRDRRVPESRDDAEDDESDEELRHEEFALSRSALNGERGTHKGS